MSKRVFAIDVTATVSGFMPSMLFFVLWPVASAVPAAAESVTSDDAEWVVANDATGNCIMVSGRSLCITVRL